MNKEEYNSQGMPASEDKPDVNDDEPESQMMARRMPISERLERRIGKELDQENALQEQLSKIQAELEIQTKALVCAKRAELACQRIS